VRLMYWGKDGGKYSQVWGWWLVEIMRLFSVVLLCFENGSREAYHEHAFNCFSWVLSGRLRECHLDGHVEIHAPSWRPFIPRRSTFHMVISEGRSWVLSFRGPWTDTWRERAAGRTVTLTHGRRVVG